MEQKKNIYYINIFPNIRKYWPCGFLVGAGGKYLKSKIPKIFGHFIRDFIMDLLYTFIVYKIKSDDPIYICNEGEHHRYYQYIIDIFPTYNIKIIDDFNSLKKEIHYNEDYTIINVFPIGFRTDLKPDNNIFPSVLKNMNILFKKSPMPVGTLYFKRLLFGYNLFFKYRNDLLSQNETNNTFIILRKNANKNIFSSRIILNEKEYVEYIKKKYHNANIIYLEELDINQTSLLLQTAKNIFTYHGSCLYNLFLCSKKLEKVYEFKPSLFIDTDTCISTSDFDSEIIKQVMTENIGEKFKWTIIPFDFINKNNNNTNYETILPLNFL